MRLILLDENIPTALRRLIPGHDVRSVDYMGWSGLKNGDLIAAAEADGFEVMITADQSIRYQQNLATRRIALIVLNTNVWPLIKADPSRLLAAVETVQAGGYMAVAIGRPSLRRR